MNKIKFLAFATTFTALSAAAAQAVETRHWHYHGNFSAGVRGATAVCNVYSKSDVEGLNNRIVNFRCALKDTRDDGDGVYIQFWLDGYGKRKYQSNGGSGSTLTLNKSFKTPDPTGTAYFQVCRDGGYLVKDECMARSIRINGRF